MSRSLRIVVADDEPDMRDYFQTILPEMGHVVVAAASTGASWSPLAAKNVQNLSLPILKCQTWTGSKPQPKSTKNTPRR